MNSNMIFSSLYVLGHVFFLCLFCGFFAGRSNKMSMNMNMKFSLYVLDFSSLYVLDFSSVGELWSSLLHPQNTH